MWTEASVEISLGFKCTHAAKWRARAEPGSAGLTTARGARLLVCAHGAGISIAADVR